MKWEDSINPGCFLGFEDSSNTATELETEGKFPPNLVHGSYSGFAPSDSTAADQKEMLALSAEDTIDPRNLQTKPKPVETASRRDVCH